MAKVSNTTLFKHVQQYIREVYADRLRQAGFFSYRGEDIHWYRLVNNDVIHSVYFVTSYPGFPIMLEIGYGCHPLFIPPILQRSPYMRPVPGNEQMYRVIPELVPGSMPNGVQRSQLHGTLNKIYRVPDVMVHCPAEDHTAQLLLDHVLSVLDSVDTPAACFDKHKCWRLSQIQSGSWLTMTPYFVDEVLYWEDNALYQYCMDYVSGKIQWIENVVKSGRHIRTVESEELAQLKVLKNVFMEGNIQDYLWALDTRARNTRKIIEKYTYITEIS